LGPPAGVDDDRCSVRGQGDNLRGANREKIVAIELACIQAVRKPWGSLDLRPWSKLRKVGDAIGELWFQRPDLAAPEPALLLKLLFTTQPLSIQVHPDDAYAQSVGLKRGKTEAWYILSAAPDAEVAIGLKRRLTPQQLRVSIEDHSISDLVQWRRVLKDDVVFVPAGTIHAIGPGLAIAEIQQRSDATFRLFDYGRQRELHADKAVAAANAGSPQRQSVRQRLTDVRTLLVASPQFILELVDLPPKSNWKLNAERETWVLVLDGCAQIELINASVGEAIFLEADSARIAVGPEGITYLLAYLGPKPDPGLLQGADGWSAGAPLHDQPSSPPDHLITAGSPIRSMEART
jgi:mannose-6-phosphate isomerase